MRNRCFRNPRLCMLIFTVFSFSTLAMAVRVPAYVFPNEDSEVITHLRITEKDLAQYSKVLDPSLDGDWYWTTYEDTFTGYVNKKDVDSKNRLKPGTVIRTKATYSSWPLTKYEEGDRVRVRSRLSVGRVTIVKEIPIYFRFEAPEPQQPVVQEPVQSVEPPPPTEPSTVTLEETPAPVPEPGSQPANPEPPVEETVEPIALDAEPDTDPAAIPEIAEETPAPEIEEITASQPESQEEGEIDPLLEEKPRISPQELASMAPPPIDLFQEFEGYLRIISPEDPMVGVFRYQLETRSGRRIVYVDTAQLLDESFLEYINTWINVRGTLEETDPEQALYIEAGNIWVAP